MIRHALLCAPLCLALAWAQDTESAKTDVAWKTDNARVNGLVEALTRDEKLSLVHQTPYTGTQNFAGYIKAVPRLGIPALNLADGETGVNAVVDATQLPSQLNVGATFSLDLARRHGTVAAKEARLLNASVLLAPRVNLLRDPFTGEFWRSFSEDPYLTAELATRSVWAMVNQGTLPTAKFLGASSTGAARGDKVQVDAQVLHEVYLSAHEALVKAGVAAIVCPTTMVNGVAACESDELLNRTVRGDWNFTGIVMSDRDATHSTVPSLVAGLDWERGQVRYYGDALRDAIYGGSKTMSESYLNRAVHRILSTYDKFGLLDGKGPQGNFTGPLLDTEALPSDVVEAHADEAYEMAVGSGVLLKNADKALPLVNSPSLAVIGASGLQLINGPGGEGAFGFAKRKMSPLAALQAAQPDSPIKTAIGVDMYGTVVPPEALRTQGWKQTGLEQFESSADKTSIVPTINYTGAETLPPDDYVDWTGQMLAQERGVYRIGLQRYYPSVGSHTVNDSAYFREATTGRTTGQWLMDEAGPFNSTAPLGNGGLRPWSSSVPTPDGWDVIAADLDLESGWHNISLSVPALFAGDRGYARLTWTPPATRRDRIAEAVAVAASVDVPIVFAHAESPAQVGMRLVDGHDELIAAVARANRRTVVVLHTSEPVLMPWLPDVAAVLWMGYPGQEGGRAVADLLRGRRSPMGRLPVTFPASAETSLTRNPAFAERVHTDQGWAVVSEGINCGYRGYLANRTTTLFPFGHGLSYTQFRFTDLNLTVTRGQGEEVAVDVQLQMHNVGAVTGNAVPQMYLGPPATAARDYPGIQFPVAKLVGFSNIEVPPGKMLPAYGHVSARDLSFWDPPTRTWIVAKGTREVWVGENAESKVLNGTVTI